ncbi:type II toxin-antitoxin system HicA family toxin [Aeromonas caviae]|uniref:type II toxin-antitoxin system HicA family toxin n=1 Tax=Aeromonas caviae TaxID=648 RepID=UPI002B49860A|nr:type II toxin-antitoxin system HicA family toxin [Aeromonas caviae]
MFFKKFRPECKDVKNALTRMGFELRKGNSGSSHEQWVKHIDGRIYKVTVDCPKAPFGDELVKSMANQAGVSKRTFLEYCKDKKKKGHPLESNVTGPA